MTHSSPAGKTSNKDICIHFDDCQAPGPNPSILHTLCWILKNHSAAFVHINFSKIFHVVNHQKWNVPIEIYKSINLQDILDDAHCIVFMSEVLMFLLWPTDKGSFAGWICCWSNDFDYLSMKLSRVLHKSIW